MIYRNECLRTGLPLELNKALSSGIPRNRILVIGCHACQHLSEEIIEISQSFGIGSIAVMPCCQKDLTRGSSWKSTSKNLGIRLDHFMDILLAGKSMSSSTSSSSTSSNNNNNNHNYEVRMKCINSKITPQNRIILCRNLSPDERDATKDFMERNRQNAHTKLEIAYHRAHHPHPHHHHHDGSSSNNTTDNKGSFLRLSSFVPSFMSYNSKIPITTTLGYIALGFIMGVGTSTLFNQKQQQRS